MTPAETLADEMLNYEGVFGEATRMKIAHWAHRVRALSKSDEQLCLSPLGYETVMNGLDWRCCRVSGHQGDHCYTPRGVPPTGEHS